MDLMSTGACNYVVPSAQNKKKSANFKTFEREPYEPFQVEQYNLIRSCSDKKNFSPCFACAPQPAFIMYPKDTLSKCRS